MSRPILDALVSVGLIDPNPPVWVDINCPDIGIPPDFTIIFDKINYCPIHLHVHKVMIMAASTLVRNAILLDPTITELTLNGPELLITNKAYQAEVLNLYMTALYNTNHGFYNVLKVSHIISQLEDYMMSNFALFQSLDHINKMMNVSEPLFREWSDGDIPLYVDIFLKVKKMSKTKARNMWESIPGRYMGSILNEIHSRGQKLNFHKVGKLPFDMFDD